MPPIVSNEYKEERKQIILQSAFECFAEKGFQIATIDDIVKQSGISKGSIYNYFDSKDDIYIELMNATTKENINLLKNNMQQYNSTKDKLEYFFSVYSNLENNDQYLNSVLVYIEFWLYSSRKSALRNLMIDRYHLYLDFFKDLIIEGITNGQCSPTADPEEISHILWGIIDGVSLHYAMLTPNNYPFKEIINQSRCFIFNELKI
ncbi:TetR/AcrR family transcriptional regulator [Peribacillus sp. SCS-155]|uniref:TetR/AcrR family transcriptional regulator n=1 Tax=Peribacillus sedimenti TaxID=3115297 RepID=UPI003905FE15